MTLPDSIKQARKTAGLTQAEAAALIHSKLRTWQDQESGKARMHQATWELFCIAVGVVSADDVKARYAALKGKR